MYSVIHRITTIDKDAMVCYYNFSIKGRSYAEHYATKGAREGMANKVNSYNTKKEKSSR